MMNSDEREAALVQMQATSDAFYSAARSIGNHPFIEFAGLMNEYIKACREAHLQGIDFSDCNQHSGMALPLHSTMSKYINEKLACIFSGTKVLDTKVNESAFQESEAVAQR